MQTAGENVAAGQERSKFSQTSGLEGLDKGEVQAEQLADKALLLLLVHVPISSNMFALSVYK
jgi:hypothetical protein